MDKRKLSKKDIDSRIEKLSTKLEDLAKSNSLSIANGYGEQIDPSEIVDTIREMVSNACEESIQSIAPAIIASLENSLEDYERLTGNYYQDLGYQEMCALKLASEMQEIARIKEELETKHLDLKKQTEEKILNLKKEKKQKESLLDMLGSKIYKSKIGVITILTLLFICEVFFLGGAFEDGDGSIVIESWGIATGILAGFFCVALGWVALLKSSKIKLNAKIVGSIIIISLIGAGYFILSYLRALFSESTHDTYIHYFFLNLVMFAGTFLMKYFFWPNQKETQHNKSIKAHKKKIHANKKAILKLEKELEKRTKQKEKEIQKLNKKAKDEQEGIRKELLKQQKAITESAQNFNSMLGLGNALFDQIKAIGNEQMAEFIQNYNILIQHENNLPIPQPLVILNNPFGEYTKLEYAINLKNKNNGTSYNIN